MNDHTRALRGAAQGWTNRATRSNRRFLWCVDCPKLEGAGYSFTLTVKDCPPTAAAWTTLRRLFQRRLERLGAIRVHWLTEWQRRGVPHLHGCVWFPKGEPGAYIVQSWLAVAADTYGAERQSQDFKPITDSLGWLQYLAKHADRGVFNYQRAATGIPKGWESSTGRMWGHTGIWPIVPPQKIRMDESGFHAFRRIALGWRYANARAEVDPVKRKRRMLSARRALRAKSRKQSFVRGGAEWLAMPISRQVFIHLALSGYDFQWAQDDAPEELPSMITGASQELFPPAE